MAMKRQKYKWVLQSSSLALAVCLTLFGQRSVVALSDPNRPVNDKWALVVGISQFKDTNMNLKYPAKDARDFAEFLVRSGKFAPDHVKLLLNKDATRENVLDTMGDKWLPRVAGPDDLVVIYISTHGSPSALDVGGVNYLLAHDSDKERLYSTGIAMQDLTRIIKGRIQSDRMVIILDACHSGAVSDPGQKGIVRQGNLDAEEIALGTGQLVICSSDTNQISWESKRYQNSVFTKNLISALQVEGDKTALSKAFLALKDNVATEVRRDRGAQQTPVLKGKWQGDELVIAVPPAHPAKGLDLSETLADTGRVSPTAEAELSTTVQIPEPSKEQTRIAVLPETSQRSPSKGELEKSQPAPVTPSLSILSGPALVAIMPFGGPEKVKSEAGLVFAMKSKGFHKPREAELNDVPEALREAVTEELRKRLGNVILGPKEMTELRSRAGVGAMRSAALGSVADYVLDCTVHNVEFNGDELFGAKWTIEFSFQLISSGTKKTVASMSEHSSEGTISSSVDPLSGIYDNACKKVATIIVDKITSKLSKAALIKN